MEFNFDNETELLQASNGANGENSYWIVSKQPEVKAEDMNRIIQIIDEDGKETNYTLKKFMEIIDTQSLSGFIS